MIYTAEVEHMCPLAKGAYHGPAPIPEEGEWVKVKKVEDISGFTHGIGWCAPQQGACKLSLNVKDGIIEDGGFQGSGCAISQASVDMMLDNCIGRPVEEAIRLAEKFHGMIQGEITDEEELEELEEAAALQDISHMPARVKCAMLGWRTMKEMLEEPEKAKKEDN